MSNKSGVLYHKGKSGTIYQWRSWTEGARLFTEYGQMGGKLQVAYRDCVGKNVGRSNETTAAEQADAELVSLYKYQLDRKYSRSVEDAEQPLLLPMLAKDFEKEKKKVQYPVFVQPKFDGVRCLAFMEDGEVVLLSRSGKPYNVPHIKEQLKALFIVLGDTMVLDGELYIHNTGFQTITSWVKKLRPETAKVEYWIYDIADDEMAWYERMDMLGIIGLYLTHSGDLSKSLKLSPTGEANCELDVYKFQAEFIEEGYEGAIVRTPDHLYRFGYRSGGLLKVKTFKDAEYEIVGYRAGEGSYRDCVIWECVDKQSGKTFSVNPKGTFEEKADWLANADSYLGGSLKVKYFELTDDGLPRFPVGIGIRMSEDM